MRSNLPPATPEPPEWKGEAVMWLGPNGSMYVISGTHPERPGVMVVDELVPPETSPLDRALEDFTARRKAKRENVKPRVPDPGKPDPTYRKDMDALARAMSTPLPHDPDIHTRLMPWRVE